MIKRIIESFLFWARWVLIPFYFVLFGALIVYAIFDIREFIHYLGELRHITRESAMLTFIELIDMAMIANLGKMIITGSYNSFVSKDHGFKGENISSGMLKVKMATSLIGVTSIGLLQKSIDVSSTSWDVLYKLAFVHVLFLLGAVVLEVVDYMHTKSAVIEYKLHH